MHRSIRIFLIGAACASFCAAAPSKPNIVFMLADDLGYGELGCYGQEKIKTPHVDQLAKQGMKFTRHYSGAPVCAPARCVLMTGTNLSRAEIRGNRDSGNGRKFPGQWPLTADAVTIAEVLKQAGYATGAFGKWGLGPSDSPGSPIKQGFDVFYGYNCQRNAHSYYPPYLDSGEREITVNKNPVPGHKRQPRGEVKASDYTAENYAPDLILAEAIKFIDANKDKPFFLYLPFVEPHVSIQPPQRWIDQYPESWDKGREYRGQNGYLPHPRPRAGYAAMISHLDEHVGAVLKRLDEHGLADNTVVIFTSDNGPTHCAGGMDCKFFNSSGGLRGAKGSCYEGGIRVPCVVKWPGKVKPGAVTDMPSYFPDWFKTLAAIGGGKLPAAGVGGVDLNPVLLGEATPARPRPMVWDFHGYGGIVAVRDGKWKAVKKNLLRKKQTPWELYDLDADGKEQHNLAAAHPDVVKRLEKFWLENRTVEPDFPVPAVDGKKTLP